MIVGVMRRGLSGAEWARLDLFERIALCDVYAREAAQLAQAASPEMRPKYEAIAAEWKKLAAEMEKAAREDAMGESTDNPPSQVECSNCRNSGWVCGEHDRADDCKSELVPCPWCNRRERAQPSAR